VLSSATNAQSKRHFPVESTLRNQATRVARARPAVFLDRDGVLNLDSGYVHTPEAFQWLMGAKEAVRLLNQAGLLVFVITNQSGVARGYFEETQVRALHDWMVAELNAAGAHLDAIYYCPYHGEGIVEGYCIADHPDRKPNPGMIKAAACDWPVDLSQSFLIGSSGSDLEAARRAGIDSYLFTDGDLAEFVLEILAERGFGADLVRAR
jgi:D-glycero-D-manno-heptose 1,7-bisphosphate phosphatase